MTYHRHMMKKIDVNLSSDGGKENARMKIR
jgi:hypothetical protein